MLHSGRFGVSKQVQVGKQQGDHIGQIFSQWVPVYFGQWFE
jgi:hypothetical protein